MQCKLKDSHLCAFHLNESFLEQFFSSLCFCFWGCVWNEARVWISTCESLQALWIWIQNVLENKQHIIRTNWPIKSLSELWIKEKLALDLLHSLSFINHHDDLDPSYSLLTSAIHIQPIKHELNNLIYCPINLSYR